MSDILAHLFQVAHGKFLCISEKRLHSLAVHGGRRFQKQSAVGEAEALLFPIKLAEFRLWLIRSHDAQGQGDGAAVGRKLLQSIAQNQHVRHMVAVQMGEQDSR